ncbi:hypothetical protein EKPJFOCH_2043 [Methylobacterium thuringiense]|uniref:Uncharacterized protein n=1 Tax=Methylobacterium thuringiense TaxID=1003091 RepID=A0ABQ4TMN1_9HYPH|nr:hypothetical protein EKPJFOCH_2043 [Methylobacterium thuringiense]
MAKPSLGLRRDGRNFGVPKSVTFQVKPQTLAQFPVA